MPDLLAAVASEYGIFNVQDTQFAGGAAGDSDVNASTGTDDTAAIQAAVSALEAAGGGKLYFPPGFYKITSPIILNDACAYELEGAGRYNTYIAGNFAGFLISRAVNADGAVPIYIHGINFKNRHASGGGIRLLSSDGSKVEYCSIQASTFGVQLGGDGTPTTATWTANSTGTSMVVTGISGTITNSSGDAIPLPVRLITGSGVPSGTSILSQSGGYTGGNGTYITDNPTTCNGVGTVGTSPDAPTCFSTVISHCSISGNGTYNIVPASSYDCVAIQMSNNTIARDCHITAVAVGIRGYGGGNTIKGCQIESITTGIQLGKDGVGDDFTSYGTTIAGCQIESAVTGIELHLAADCLISGVVIQGNVVLGFHNSTYGILVDDANNVTFAGCVVGGTFVTGSVYVASASSKNVLFLGCQGIASKAGGANYSGIKTIACSYFGDTSCTLANLVTLAGATTLSRGERFNINDASVALGSQTFGATVTGGGSNFAAVFYDTGTTFRYG